MTRKGAKSASREWSGPRPTPEAKDGAVEQSNFYDYRVPRMNEVPLMHIEVIQTDNHPTGAGQMSTPLVAPAISNALAQLTGVRLRHTPFTPERVKKALG